MPSSPKNLFFSRKNTEKKIASQWARGRGKTSQWANHQRCLFFHQTRDERAHTTIQNKKSANFFKSKKKLKIFAKKSDFLFREWKKNLSKRKEERWMAEWSS